MSSKSPVRTPSPPAEKRWGRRTLDVEKRELLFSEPHFEEIFASGEEFTD
jgi:hypothetical protein